MDRIAKNKRKAKHCIGCCYLHIGQNVDHNHCDIHYSDARTNGHADKDIECPHKKVNLCKSCEYFSYWIHHRSSCEKEYRKGASELRDGRAIACIHFKEIKAKGRKNKRPIR
ncbi:unnamed protein product [marine sediment metagenome]|uniref:Uncharacterized protein n=1 Tax=marine sediment metagenome TaxID=412755 RepID=X1I694_9ZZZZ